MAEFSGTPTGAGRRIAVVASRFNESVTQPLLDGALDALVRHGVAADDVDVVWVPGAFELPVAARTLLASERYDAIVAVGAVIRGETPHFEYVAGEAARSIACSIVSHVRTPKPIGTPASCDACARPRAASPATYSKCGVSPRITAPTATIAS